MSGSRQSGGARMRGEDVVARCRGMGFALAGVCAAEPSARGEFFREWIGAGRHGSMTWLAREVETRLDPRALLPGARSIVVVADLYTPRGAGAGPEATREGWGKVARYARGEDYHEVVKRRLHTLCDEWRERLPAEAFRACVDTAPLLEREHAARAGLGWIGKHTLLIHPELGSYFFLGAIVTTAEITLPAGQAVEPDHCGTCTRCIDACPTDAITPYSVDASRCVSYLTIERRAEIAEPLRAGVGDWLYGCDVCQEVCPHNSPRTGEGPARNAEPAREEYAPRFVALRIDEVAAWSAEDRARALKGSAMKRATLEMMRRNAAIVKG